MLVAPAHRPRRRRRRRRPSKCASSEAADCNPDGCRRPSPLVVRVYRCARTRPSGRGFFALYDHEKETLAADLVATQEFRAQPGETRDGDLQGDPQMRSWWLTAAYRDLRNSHWRASFDLPLRPRRGQEASPLIRSTSVSPGPASAVHRHYPSDLTGTHMTTNSKVVWSEGLFLRPQHFQQQERYFERYMEARSLGCVSHGWGFSSWRSSAICCRSASWRCAARAGYFPTARPSSCRKTILCRCRSRRRRTAR